MSPTLPDDCIKHFIDGDMAAFQLIFENFSDTFYSIAYKMVLSEPEAEDLVQDVFIKLFERRHQFNFSVQFGTWATRVCLNHMIDYVKKRSRWTSKLSEIFFDITHRSNRQSVEDKQETTENVSQVRKLLEKIKPEFRLCLIMHEMEGFSYEDIAHKLDIQMGTVKSRINRAKRQLKELYEKELAE